MRRAELVENAGSGSGCSTSLQAGLDRADSDAAPCDAVALLLGDMPGVGAELVDEVTAQWQSDPSWAAVTQYADGVGHPFVFSAAVFPTLRVSARDKATWKIVEREPPTRVVRIPVDRRRLCDVDTWADYLAVCRDFGVPAAGADGPVPG